MHSQFISSDNESMTSPASGIAKPPNEALALAIRYAAVQNLVNVLRFNSLNNRLKRFSLVKLANNALGREHPLYPGRPRLAATELTLEHLRHIRQEQLVLVAENQRLSTALEKARQAWANRPYESGASVVTQTQETRALRKDGRSASRLSRAILDTISGKRNLELTTVKLLLLVRTLDKIMLRIRGLVFRDYIKANRCNVHNISKRGLIRGIAAAVLIIQGLLVKKNLCNTRYALAAIGCFMRNKHPSSVASWYDIYSAKNQHEHAATNLGQPASIAAYYDTLPSVKEWNKRRVGGNT